MHSNLPAGAENNPHAPWNQVDNLCPYCDRDIIKGMAAENADGADREYDEILEAMLEESTLCRNCYNEENADDWCNWRD